MNEINILIIVLVALSILLVLVLGLFIFQSRKNNKLIETNGELNQKLFNFVEKTQSSENEVIDLLNKNENIQRENQIKNNELIKTINELREENQKQRDELVRRDSFYEKKGQLDIIGSFESFFNGKFKNIDDFLDNFSNINGGVQSEMILENLLKASGFIKSDNKRPGNFQTQVSIGDNKRPDFLLHINDDKHVIIDSKSFMIDYDNGENEIGTLIERIYKTASVLKKKDYQLDKKSLDAVIMFIPFDDVFKHIDLSKIPRKIFLASPSTIIPMLHIINNSIETKDYTNFSALRANMLHIHDNLTQGLNEYYKAKSSIDDFVNSFSKVEKTLSSLNDIEGIFENFVEIFEIEEETNKKLTSNTKKALKK